MSIKNNREQFVFFMDSMCFLTFGGKFKGPTSISLEESFTIMRNYHCTNNVFHKGFLQ